MVVHDYSTNTYSYIDLKTGKPYEAYTPVTNGTFSNGIADMLCNMIREGKSLKDSCTELKISQSLFYAWLSVYPEFKTRYLEARKHRADYHFHRALEIADGAMGAPKELIPGIKLAVDTHKWAAEKSDPERFAKPKEEASGPSSIVINLNTGVHHPAPDDIVVDQYGTFKGFGATLDEDPDTFAVESIELNTNRWSEYGEKERASSSSESTSNDEEEQGGQN